MTEKFLMARNFFRIFTENNPVMGDSKTFCIPEARANTSTEVTSSGLVLSTGSCQDRCSENTLKIHVLVYFAILFVSQ